MREKAIAVLQDPAFEPMVREALMTWDNPDPRVVERTLAWIRAMRHDLVALLESIDDEQAPETIAINYIELKTRWIALNTKVNYQQFRTGVSDPEIAFRGTACSMLLGQVESLLTADDITKITEFLAQPIARLAA